MKNQHRKIKGYRELNQSEINAMNAIKEKAAEIGELITTLESNSDLDQRWVAMAKDELQKGFMCATRSVAKPEFF